MKSKVFIFDFDGTIADTHKFIIDISNQLAEEFSYREITKDEIESLKGKTSQEIVKILKIPIIKIPAILSKAKKIFNRDMGHIKPFDGLKDTLAQMKNAGVKIGILSSNSMENIRKFLKKHHLDIFDFVHTTSKVWSKNVSLKKLIKQEGFLKSDILYIGDETRDITAAKKIGVKIAAVTWGYNSCEVLKALEPDFIINTPQELFRLYA